MLGSSWGVDNRGVGQTFVTSLNPAVVNTRYGAHRSKNVCVVMFGLNDLFIGRAAADIYADLVARCTELRDYGWLVVVCTLTAANQGYGAESRRLAYNALIRAGHASFAHRLADVGANAEIGITGAELNFALFYPDSVHLIAPGQGVLAGIVQPEVLSL